MARSPLTAGSGMQSTCVICGAIWSLIPWLLELNSWGANVGLSFLPQAVGAATKASTDTLRLSETIVFFFLEYSYVFTLLIPRQQGCS